ncbi:MAG: VOC family protein [Pseudomonadota bacterium]|nr:VOC family protein [Pseudomonadota bacterium]
MPRLTRACPMLPAPDVAAAAAWYRDSLGFAVRFVLADYAIVERDGIELHLWTCDERRIAEHTSAYIRVDGIEAFRQRLPEVAGGGRISALEARPWGMREFYVWDPSGNLLRFGEPVEATQSESSGESRDLLAELEALSPAEQQRRTEAAAAAMIEGRL